jgi:hypothetical protein
MPQEINGEGGENAKWKIGRELQPCGAFKAVGSFLVCFAAGKRQIADGPGWESGFLEAVG